MNNNSFIEYLKDSKIDAILISNIIDLDKGFKQIKESYGSLEDFKKLIQNLHDNEIKVIIDFIPNYNSEWFIKSKQNDPAFVDYYIWSNNLPNNWVKFLLFYYLKF